MASLSPGAKHEHMRFKPWTVATVAIAALLFAAAVSHAVYEATSPVSFTWHVVLRKAYSVAAFTLVGFLLRRALAENAVETRTSLVCIACVAAYSGAIEIGQYLHGSHEGLRWNAFDVACGALGGGIATSDLAIRRFVR
jgi:hypothetical protein